jgi:hypothetical protein
VNLTKSGCAASDINDTNDDTKTIKWEKIT